MQLNWLNLTTVGLSLTAIASLSSITACSVGSQTSNQSSSPALMDSGMKGMDHSSMSMDLGPADADLDLRFIDAMTPHHEGAVVMAKDAQQKSKRPEIQKLAAEIIQAQDTEIAQMRQWRKAWYPKASDTPMAYHTQMGHMMAMTPEQKESMMMSQDLGVADAEFDLRFIDAMIPHHEGAVTMAKEVLGKTKRSEIKQMAEAILASQQAEIDQMKAWRNTWYGK
ncbi:MAG: DUF305 domain-containing protein [Thermosynechococcaceae cyanobacterium MS004]|nr:DUF305 domain-containing protein [Thermosynechococcaceae cyanobacterium MS004]